MAAFRKNSKGEFAFQLLSEVGSDYGSEANLVTLQPRDVIIAKVSSRDRRNTATLIRSHLELDDPASQVASTAVLLSKGSSSEFIDDDLGIGNYNPFKHRRLSNPTSDGETLVHLLKASLGTGILAMPMAFMNAGLLFGLVATFVIGFVCTYCIHLWVKCAQILCIRRRVPSMGFSEIAEFAFLTGPMPLRKYSTLAGFLINLAILIEMLGCCCAYIVFVARSMKQIAEHYWEVDWSLQVYMILLIPPLILLNLMRSLKYLTPFSMISNFLFIIGVCISYYYIFDDLPPITERPMFSSWHQLPIFFGTTIFALEGVGVVMPLENNMKTPEHFIGCPGVLNIGMVLVVTLYAITGFFGYLKYGEATEASVTLNLPVEHLLGQILKTMVALGIFLTYSLLFYAAMDILWPRLKSSFSRPLPVEYVFRVLLVLATVAVAAIFPNLGPLLSLIGALSLSVVGLIFPALVETLVYWEHPGLGSHWWRLWKNVAIALFGLIGLFTGTMTSLREFGH
uniref:Amino acid transporter transmembrane domain-containing protein n=1 Tax=Cuerna arida TaxID=1464854 RepID=A0A1B6FNG3_9HEMI